jgi:fumarate reductase (CoM/CoB) subunit A
MTDSSYDIIVIGGGLAALSTAIEAADQGSSVVIINKGVTGASGSSAKAAGILAAPFGHGDLKIRPGNDSAKQHSEDTIKVGYNIGNLSLIDHITRNAKDAVNWLESMGVQFSVADDGGYIQLNTPGNSCPRGCSAVGGGNAIMKKLIARAKALNITIFDNAIARELIKHEQQIIGAVIQTEQTCFSLMAHAVILAAGGATGLFPTVSGDENNTGSSLMLGFDAGAKLGNLEFIEFTLIYRVHGNILRIAGLAPFMSRGGKILNKNGLNLLNKYFPDISPPQISRAELLRTVHYEITKGNGPVLLDCTHFTKEQWSEFKKTQGSTTLDEIAKAGCNFEKEFIEVIPAAHSILAGLVVDINAATSIKGLFAAGENATGIHGAGRLAGNGLTSCVVMGRTAGNSANKFIRTQAGFHQQNKSGPHLPMEQIIGRSAINKIIENIRNLAGNSLGIVRNDLDLTHAQSKLKDISRQLQLLGVESIRHWEAKQMASLASLMIKAALRRKESRGVQFRSDQQERNEQWGLMQTVYKTQNSELIWENA